MWEIVANAVGKCSIHMSVERNTVKMNHVCFILVILNCNLLYKYFYFRVEVIRNLNKLGLIFRLWSIISDVCLLSISWVQQCFQKTIFGTGKYWISQMNFLIGVSAHSVTFILQYTTQIANTTAKSSFHQSFLISVIFKKIKNNYPICNFCVYSISGIFLSY